MAALFVFLRRRNPSLNHAPGLTPGVLAACRVGVLVDNPVHGLWCRVVYADRAGAEQQVAAPADANHLNSGFSG